MFFVCILSRILWTHSLFNFTIILVQIFLVLLTLILIPVRILHAMAQRIMSDAIILLQTLHPVHSSLLMRDDTTNLSEL